MTGEAEARYWGASEAKTPTRHPQSRPERGSVALSGVGGNVLPGTVIVDRITRVKCTRKS